MAQDVADDELAAGAPRRRDDALGVLDGLGERLLDEDMRAGLHGADGVVGMGVGQVLIETTSGFSAASASSKSAKRGAPASACRQLRASAMRRSQTPATSKPSIRA